jgi:hypothetical protein
MARVPHGHLDDAQQRLALVFAQFKLHALADIAELAPRQPSMAEPALARRLLLAFKLALHRARFRFGRESQAQPRLAHLLAPALPCPIAAPLSEAL